ncbi:type IV secretion system protein VirB10 [Sphingopyxis sp. OAS728]|uniref:TrbI/VirB10 family protein n=1 Tax=Sphingopyxis sp. OAS728 TaxID=2663823 RepID=UPI0017894366|nr:TrbI/VirB10 family protein [Sphingopyxis sp. OAS728]MBE1527879.1 type IV secretion system protein VirB10 [Sphingopyxis sp. OAS728]
MSAPATPEAESETAVAVAPPSPEAFRLEGERPRVMRLSRRAIAAAGGVAGLAIAASLFWALRTPSASEPKELYETASTARPDAVTSAPADYGKVPKLGPPLPGDLGRPIVAAQAEGKAVPVPPIAATAGEQHDPRQSAAEQARQRAVQEGDSARASRLFLASEGAPREEASPSAAPTPLADRGAGTPTPVPDSRRQFLAGGSKGPIQSTERIMAPSSPYVVQAGTLIPAALVTGIRSDLPGLISAQVTQNVYDSPTGRVLLIPQGARLVGEYDSEIAAGQSRVLLVWDRLILPGGRSIRLDRQPGADASGMAGLQDRVNNHWGRMFRAALVSTLLGVGGELSLGGEDDLARALRTGMQDTTGEAGRRVVERELAVRPTLTIRPGYAFAVFVTKDLVFEPIDPGDWQ